MTASLSSGLDLSLLLLVVGAAVNDLASRRIPNRLLLAGALAALALHAGAAAPGAALLTALAGGALGLALFLPLYCLRGMAAGDVKLLATVGVFVGPATIFQIAVLSMCAGGVMALAVVIANGRWRAALVNVRSLLRPLWMRLLGLPLVAEPMPGPSVGNIPYGLAIAAGTLFTLAGRQL
jgi:prepilin peptidase CpaA